MFKKNHKHLIKLPKNPESVLPPLIFPPKNKTEEARLTKLRKQKKIRKLGPRLYTSLPLSSAESVVQAYWIQVVSSLFPDVLLSHRSALEYKPAPDGSVVLTSTTNRVVRYPGLTLKFVRGPGILADDFAFAGFHASSTARAFLENLSTGKRTQSQSLSASELELKLETILKAKGEAGINRIRDEARQIAKKLRWQKEFQKFDLMIGALLGTKPAAGLQSDAAKARARGRAIDVSRIKRFDLLFAELCATPLKEIKENFKAPDHFFNKAFFDSYFSNYIEGTTFEIQEAEEIVFDKKIPLKRPKDAHDILKTYVIVSDPNSLKRVPQNFQEFEKILKQRHMQLMSERPEADPGEYKTKPNRAGSMHFVHPDEISGTFEKGFERYQELPAGLAKSIFMMFLVAEVHPFTDGNGRIARIMMNAELFSQGLSTIIIPNVYRDDYISALRALTRRDRPDPLIRMLSRAHEFSHLKFSPYATALQAIDEKNWFRDPSEAQLIE